MGIISEKITQILEEADITRAIISKPSSKSSEYRKKYPFVGSNIWNEYGSNLFLCENEKNIEMIRGL